MFYICCYKIVKIMETKKIKISYDTTAEDALEIAQSILDSLGIEYEMSGEETITIEYKVERK